MTNQKRIRRKYHNREKIIVDKCNHEYIVFAILDMILPQITGIHIYFHYFCQGIGTKLSKKIDDLAIKKGYKVLYTMSSMNAIKFYESNGYYLVVSSRFWSDNRVWIHCAKMKKRLVNKTK